MANVAVVGGGAAGLSAARMLLRAGLNVHVFEQGRVLGGRARSEVVEGCVVDVGAQLIGSGFSALREFARALECGHLLVRSPGRDALWRKGRAYAITYGNIASMVTSLALPTTLKLRLGARYVPFLLRHGGELNPGDLTLSGVLELDAESVADWGVREIGRDFVELMAYPLLGAYYGSTPEETSVLLYHALARAGMDVSVYAVRGGMGALFEEAGKALQQQGVAVHTEATVHQVMEDDEGVTIDGERYDAAVLAVPPKALRSMYEPLPPLSDWLDGVRFAGSAVLALFLRDRVNADYFGLSIPRNESGSDLVAICIVQQKLPSLVPAHRSLLLCLGAPAANPEILADPQAGVERMILSAEQIMPGIRARIEYAKLYRHEEGYPIFYPGYARHLQSFPDVSRRVQLAGDYLASPTVEGAVRSGARAAQRVIAYLAAAAA